MRTLCVVAVALPALAVAGHAASLKPGQYDLDGIQQLCLVKDGSA